MKTIKNSDDGDANDFFDVEKTEIKEIEFICIKIKNLNMEIKSGIDKLSSKEVEKVKKNLSKTLLLIDVILRKKLRKENEKMENKTKRK